MPLLNLSDYAMEARSRSPKDVYDYIASGADDERTRDDNQLAFARLRLLPRILVKVNEIDTTGEIFGSSFSSPIMIGPSAFHQLVHPEGEVATAKAASNKDTMMIVSTMATCSLEEIKGNLNKGWFQLYVYKDRKITENLVRRAERAGYSAIVITVDTPLMGNREADKRNKFKLPSGCIAANFSGAVNNVSYESGQSTVASYTNDNFDRDFTWKDIKWLRSLTKLPIVLKGVLHPDDAELAVEHGIDAIIVSNHGGRQVDTTPATIEIFPEIASVVAGRIPLLLDGGVRRGTDIIKALALGARAVLIGRPVLWGLCVDGQKGVEDVLSILHKELAHNMALMGYPSIAAIQGSKSKVTYEGPPLGFKAKL